MLSLTEFLDQGLTAYHVTALAADALRENGFQQLCEAEDWRLEAGGKYFVIRNDSSVLAFQIPEGDIGGFLMAAAHTDSPAFKIKKTMCNDRYASLSVERYGGMLLSTWFDRPLTVAGRLLVEKEGVISSQNVALATPVVIPSVAIHLQKDASGNFLNPAVDLLPLLGGASAAGRLENALQDAADGEILARDLFVVPSSPAFLWGEDGEYVTAPRLDDLQCVYGLLCGFLASKPASHVSVLALFDNEEVGSKTRQGADSTFLKDTLARVMDAFTADGEVRRRWLAGSFMVSADNAHAVHPNHPELSDGDGGKCYPNGGIVIKHNAMQRYTTDAYSEAVFASLCRRLGLPLQHFTNRADKLGGSTLGNLSTTHLPVAAVDIGLAQLAMHSAVETAGTKDGADLCRAMTCYFSSTLCVSSEGTHWEINE